MLTFNRTRTKKYNFDSGVVGGLFIVVAVLLFALGYGLNIYKLVTFDGALGEMAALEIVRVIGIFIAPIGAVTGYF
jgi:hypothetical protein